MVDDWSGGGLVTQGMLAAVVEQSTGDVGGGTTVVIYDEGMNTVVDSHSASFHFSVIADPQWYVYLKSNVQTIGTTHSLLVLQYGMDRW